MTDAGALWYLESRQIANRLKVLLRSPGRTAFYVLFAVYLVFVAFLRGRAGQQLLEVSEPYASAAFFAYVALLAVVGYGAASGYAGAFSSTADARFLTGSGLDERLVVLWLQVRRSASAMGRMIVTLLLYALLVSHSVTTLSFALTILGGTAAATAISVPMLTLRRTIGERLAKALCGALAAIALLPMLIVLSSLFMPMTTALGIEHLGPGAAVNALLHGNPWAIAALWTFSALMLAAAWSSGKDLYPELYAASLRMQQFRKHTRRGASVIFTAERHYVRRSVGGGLHPFFDLFRGSWAIVWKEWIAFVRSPGLQRLFAAGAVGSAIVGVSLAAIALRSAHPQETGLTMLAPAFTTVLITIAMGSAVTLAGDLRKPLWWAGPDPLWLRLFAWACGTSWRTGALIYCGLLAWSLTMRMPVVALLGIPASIVAVIYLRSVGLFIYSLFPSTVDQRGPLAFVRALITYVLSVPPIVAAALTFFLAIHRLDVAGGVAIASAIAESLILVQLASLRILGSGAAFTQLESA